MLAHYVLAMGKKKVEQGKGIWALWGEEGAGCSIKWVVRVGLMEKMRFEQKLEESERGELVKMSTEEEQPEQSP